MSIRETRICKKCLIKKDLENDYELNSNKSLHRRVVCKECRRSERRKRYKLNAEREKQQRRKRYKINRKEELEYSKNYLKNPINLSKKIRRQKWRRNNDEMFALKERIRASIRKAFINNGYSKNSKTAEILGCDFKTFYDYITKQFPEGMNWENRDKWHLDHIAPISMAVNEEEVYELNHYTNFQPLWITENLTKSDNVDMKSLIKCLLLTDKNK